MSEFDNANFLIHSSIIKSSKLIETLYSNEQEEKEDEKQNYDDYIQNGFLLLYQNFIKKYSNVNGNEWLTIECINKYTSVFESINLHTNFQKPDVKEYFNPKLRYLLIVDFLLSMKKADLISGFSFENINDNEVLSFFKQLSHYYDFMNYIDVCPIFLSYLKYMLVLYLLTCERNIIETHFDNIIWELDQFFKFNVLIHVYNEFDNNLQAIKDIKKHFSRIVNNIKEYDPNKDYVTNTEHLKKKYYLKMFDSSYSHNMIGLSYANMIDRESRYFHNNFYISNFSRLSKGGNKIFYVCNEKDKSKYQCCIIQKKCDTFLNECMPPLNLFACRIFQQMSLIENDFNNYLNHLDIGINKYDNFISFKSPNIPFQALPGYTFKFLTFIGVLPRNLEAFRSILYHDLFNLNYKQYEIFDIAYDMCHMNIISYMTKTKMIHRDDSFIPIHDIYHEDINLFLKKSGIINHTFTNDVNFTQYIQLSMVR